MVCQEQVSSNQLVLLPSMKWLGLCSAEKCQMITSFGSNRPRGLSPPSPQQASKACVLQRIMDSYTIMPHVSGVTKLTSGRICSLVSW